MYELIEHRKLDVAAATITFSNIPQNYSDLLLKVSLRASSTSDHYHDIDITFNGESARSWRGFYGLGTTAAGNGSSSFNIVSAAAGTVVSANTFSSTDIFISNYTSTGPKAISSEFIVSNNSTSQTNTQLAANFITNSAAVTELTLFFPFSGGNTFTQHSSATLYGVNRRAGIGRAPLAMGGYMSYSNGYWVHTFPSSGSFIPFTNMDVEYLVIAGGGGGGGRHAGGGGAGGYREVTSQAVSANTNYTVTIGAGGAGAINGDTNASRQGSSGSNSVFNTITSAGGGGGGGAVSEAGANGGSGGGGTYQGPVGTGNTPSVSPSQGNNGGPGAQGGGTYQGGGGGGAGSVGGSAVPGQAGNGGSGAVSLITGTPVFRAAGGGGGGWTSSPAGLGGVGGGGDGVGFAGSSAAGNGTTNSGSGGGGGGGASSAGGNGGSGIVIVRYRA